MQRVRALSLVLLAASWASCVEPSSDDSTHEPAAPVDELPPAWPAGAEVTVVEAGRTYVRLRWTPATDDVGVERYPISGEDVGEHYSTSSSMLISGLTPGQTYDVEIHAQDAAGNSTAYPLTIQASTASGCTATLPVVPARITR